MNPTPQDITQDPVFQALRTAARIAAKNAYAPYSSFHVGAALWSDGQVFAGCNVENASYGLTQCAERVAIGNAIAGGHRKIDALLIYTPTPESTPPCGACRQVLFEFNPDMKIWLTCDAPTPPREFTAKALLPETFTFDPPGKKLI